MLHWTPPMPDNRCRRAYGWWSWRKVHRYFVALSFSCSAMSAAISGISRSQSAMIREMERPAASVFLILSSRRHMKAGKLTACCSFVVSSLAMMREVYHRYGKKQLEYPQNSDIAVTFAPA